jgi:hypothetical protein
MDEYGQQTGSDHMSFGIYNSNAFRNASGVVNISASANVEVRRESDGGLASIFSDRAGTAAITQVAYPGTTGFKANASGYFEFFAAGGTEGYKVRVYSDDLTLDKTVRYQRTGTAGEHDAGVTGAQLMGTTNPAGARTILETYSQAEVVALLAVRIGTMAFVPAFADVSAIAFDCDGAAYSRTTYATLSAKMVKSATATITIASPGVVTWTAHGLQNHMPVKFTTTGALPTGLLVGHTYWVINKATDTFQLSLVPGGTAINTSGTQSGVHTAISAPHGDGDGSTTFNVPDMRDQVPVGYGAATLAETFNSAQVDAGTDNITIKGNHVAWVTGMQIDLQTSGTLPTGLTAGTNYIVRTGNNTIKIATSLANAQNGTVVNITGAGSGDHTITHTRIVRGLGEGGGEDAHAMSLTELLSHQHSMMSSTGYTLGGTDNRTIPGSSVLTSAAGGNAAMNIAQPFKGGRWVVYHT